MKRKRNSDGTFRSAGTRKKITNRSLRAHWVEAEVAARKERGVSFFGIAKMIGAAARGEIPSKVSIPPGAEFPVGYKITERGARKAYRRQESRGGSNNTSQQTSPKISRTPRRPTESAEEWRALANLRIEDWFLKLQLRIREGHLPSIGAATDLLNLSGKINGHLGGRRTEPATNLFLQKPPLDWENQLEIVRAMPLRDREKWTRIWNKATKLAEKQKKGTSKHSLVARNSQSPHNLAPSCLESGEVTQFGKKIGTSASEPDTMVSGVAENSGDLENAAMGASGPHREKERQTNRGMETEEPNGGKTTTSDSSDLKTRAEAATAPLSPRVDADWRLMGREVLRFLSSNKSKVYFSWQIATAVGWDEDSVGRMLGALINTGGVVRLPNGQWRYNPPAKIAS